MIVGTSGLHTMEEGDPLLKCFQRGGANSRCCFKTIEKYVRNLYIGQMSLKRQFFLKNFQKVMIDQ